MSFDTKAEADKRLVISTLGLIALAGIFMISQSEWFTLFWTYSGILLWPVSIAFIFFFLFGVLMSFWVIVRTVSYKTRMGFKTLMALAFSICSVVIAGFLIYKTLSNQAG